MSQSEYIPGLPVAPAQGAIRLPIVTTLFTTIAGYLKPAPAQRMAKADPLDLGDVKGAKKRPDETNYLCDLGMEVG